MAMRKGMTGSHAWAAVVLAASATTWAAPQEGHKPARSGEVKRQVTGPAGGSRSVDIRRAPGQLDRSYQATRPGGASVSRSVEIDRATGTVEAETKIVGPRGNTIDRKVEIERTPGGIERDISITRPGGSFQQSVRVDRAIAPGPMEYGPIWGLGGRPPVQNSTSFGFFFGPPVPPPIVVAPAPVFGPPVWFGGAVVGGGMVGGAVVGGPVVEVVQPPPVVVAPTPYRIEAPPQVVDVVNEEVTRLASNHAKSRRDACQHLGRLGDARAVVPLMERLKFDKDADVRQVAAWALGEIGDPRAALYLQRAAVYDKKDHVRDAAKTAMTRLEAVKASQPVVADPAGSAPAMQTASQSGSRPPVGTRSTMPVATASTPPPPAPGAAPEARLARANDAWPPRAAMPAANRQSPPPAPAPASQPAVGTAPASSSSDPLADPLPPLETPH